ncbi:MAG: type II toxin-antitoxin system HicB family antitoxin [Bacteroidota bacterium]
MKNDLLKYKGFIGSVQFSAEDDIFWGKIIGIRDSVTFEGATVAALKKGFKEAVDDYIDLCKRYNKPVQKSMTGNFNIRINPELHQIAAYSATEKGISLNKYVQEAIQSYVQEAETPYQATRKKR